MTHEQSQTTGVYLAFTEKELPLFYESRLLLDALTLYDDNLMAKAIPFATRQTAFTMY